MKSTFVIGHEKLICRVLSNFLSNAIEHTQAGNRIIITVECEEQTAKVSVENEGEFLSQEEISHIWEQFYKVKNRNIAGTGLGLSICKEILDLHHTSYGVENTTNGVCFFFFIQFE